MMSEVKTRNFRLSPCIETSTGHKFVFVDYRTDMTIYFNECKVYRTLGEVHLKNDAGRAGWIKNAADLPPCLVAEFEHIEEFGEMRKRDHIVDPNYGTIDD